MANKTVLCIDDDRMIRLSICDYLEDSGYTVYQAENGQKGLSQFHEKHPAVVLVDLRMPDITGLEVLKSIKATCSVVPVIVISGTGDIQDVIEALRLGAWDYLTKPIEDMAILELAIEKGLERARILEENRTYKEQLERLVEQKTVALKQLKKVLKAMQQTQNRLIQSEKLAALGGLVAGVAHEINTPIGIGVTAASHLSLKTTDLEKIYHSGSMRRTDLERYLKTAQESSNMILSNLYRAAELIKSFKQVSVSQSSQEYRTFRLKEYIHDVLLSLGPKLKAASPHITVHCPNDLEITSYPGAYSQILTNFIMNSLIHGFDETQQQREIIIRLAVYGETLQLQYSDNGKGIAPEHQLKIFDPFFTTRGGQQKGSGLGMFIVYNLVTQQLHGSINCESAPSQGVMFQIEVPVKLPEIERM
ncbi:hybrid sensor histidine kinase/response regulator [candidate division KSB3 bacterium]|uniref:histidine kinase n=1 Tax=candidate division KSB3 bacterium TaxID=2044937 RepID=A0A2G6KFV6_9BACT|nr:MAG: hybrid sensor histidine kinase/response regulator [candidate division KSB3 bacterium]